MAQSPRLGRLLLKVFAAIRHDYFVDAPSFATLLNDAVVLIDVVLLRHSVFALPIVVVARRDCCSGDRSGSPDHAVALERSQIVSLLS